MTSSTPSDIQNMLENEELSEENRQLLTDLLLLQLKQMGPEDGCGCGGPEDDLLISQGMLRLEFERKCIP